MERQSNLIQYQSSENQLLSFAEIVDFLHRRWKIIAGAAIFLFGLTLVAVYSVTPIYSGSTELLLETPRENVLGTDSLTAGMILSSAVVESQLAILKSKSVLRRVVEKENLAKDPEFGGLEQRTWLASLVQYIPSPWKPAQDNMSDSKPRDPAAVAVGLLGDAAKVSRVGQSNVIRITVSSNSPSKAAALANTLADAYLTDQLEARYESARRASDWLNERQKLLQAEVSISESAVEEFRIRHNLLATSSGSLTEQQLSELNTALIKARAETATKRSSFEQVQKLLANDGDVMTNPDILRSGAVSQLRARLTAIGPAEADLRSTYGERHPDVLKLQAERRVLEEQIKGEIGQAIGNLKSELEAAEWREASLAQSLAMVSDQSGVDNQVAVQLRDLQRVAAANKQIYESFLSRAKIAEEETTLPTTEARIISPAALADKPDFPRKKLFAALGLVMGLCLGTGMAILLEILRPGFMAQRQVQEVLDLPVLASVPRMRAWEQRGDGPVPQLLEDLNQRPFSSYTEAIRSLSFVIDTTSSAGELPPRVVQVTSTMPGEGKTTLAISLACSSAAAGELVLLIDADLRLGAASRIFGKKSAVGLFDVLTSSADAQDSIYFHEQSGVYVLPAGARARNPPAILDSDRMQKLIGYARSTFNRIIIDSPPVAVAVDAAVLSRVADRVVFAVKWSDTAREAVSQAIAQLRRTGQVTGVVLTMVDERKLPRYGRYLSLESKLDSKIVRSRKNTVTPKQTNRRLAGRQKISTTDDH